MGTASCIKVQRPFFCLITCFSIHVLFEILLIYYRSQFAFSANISGLPCSLLAIGNTSDNTAKMVFVAVAGIVGEAEQV